MESRLQLSSQVVHDINPDMIGLFFEDINCAADGGLYAEMLENRSFEAVKTKGTGRNYVLREDNLYAWSSSCGKEDELEININMPLSEKNPHYLRFTAREAYDGFANKAYDGLCLKAGMTYKISFYAKEVQYTEGDIEVSLVRFADGANGERNGADVVSNDAGLTANKTYGKAVIKFISAQPEPDWYKVMIGDCERMEWHRYETEITVSEDVKGASFVVSLTKPGCVEFDLLSMIPGDAVAGIFRKDLFEALANLHPGFLRFPGGCIVEGTSIMRRYRWKDTVGELKDRKINTNLWAAVGGNTSHAWEMPDSHYMQSYGIGFYEYFLLCELLSTEKRTCKAVPVLNVGVACQFRSYETVDMGTPEFDEYVQDALDLIEFANGPVDGRWGALRAAMGHPESFNLEMIAIGNEQWESRHVNMADRYIVFEKAIHDRYPEIKCLGTAGPFVGDKLHEGAWKLYHEQVKTNPKFTYAVDEHYYVAPQWLYDNVTFYDEYPRDVYVFAGEYAAHDANLSNSVEAGLAEAAMMTGMERNGDLVKLASYAPLFNRIGHSHWTPDMIWFDEDSVTLTPSYYTQMMFSTFAGDKTLDLGGQDKTLRENKIYVSYVQTGRVEPSKRIIKLVNANTEAVNLRLINEAGEAFSGEALVATMAAASGVAKEVVATDAIATDNNHAVSTSIMSNFELCAKRAPEEVSYTELPVRISGELTLPAKSLTVVVL